MRKLAAVWVGLVLALLATTFAGTVASASTSTASPSPTDTASASPTAPATTEPAATEDPEQGVRVFVREDRTGVAGAEVVVSQGDSEVADGTTDDQGTVVIGVPEAGEYTITVDVESLPDGKQLVADSVTRQVRAGEIPPVAFRIGEPAPEGGAVDSGGFNTTLALQLAAQGLRFGLILALAAVGLSLIFGTTGLTNFAHGELVTFGALSGFLFNVTIGLPLLVAGPLAVILAGLFGWAQDAGLWAPLRRRGTGLIAMMIVSIGLALFLRFFFLMRFGGNTQSFADYQGQAGLALGPVTLRPSDLLSMGLAAVVLAVVGVALLRTKFGKAIRAVADNPALASASGINVESVIRTVWVAGAALAGLAGVLLGLVQGINYQMGLQVLLLVFAAVTLGGLGTAFGALVGSLVVGIFIEVSTLWVPTELKNIGALAVLIIILLVRPQGLLGRRERIG